MRTCANPIGGMYNCYRSICGTLLWTHVVYRYIFCFNNWTTLFLASKIFQIIITWLVIIYLIHRTDSSPHHSSPPPSSAGASDLRDQAHDQHPADDDLPEPEERLLPAAPARRQAGPAIPGGGPPDPAGGGDPAGGEEETRPRLPPQERTQGQRPLFGWHERTGDQRLNDADVPAATGLPSAVEPRWGDGAWTPRSSQSISWRRMKADQRLFFPHNLQ